MNFVNLFNCGIFTCSNCPYRLVGQNNVFPVSNMGKDSIQLLFNNFDCFVSFTLGQCLSETIDDLHSCFESIFNFFCNYFISVSEMSPSFRVPDDDPGDVDVFQLLSSDLSCIGSESELRAVLSCDFNVLILFSEHGCH